MKAVVSFCSTDIYLSAQELKEFCKLGQGADTCIWAVAGTKGFQCSYYNKNSDLMDRWKQGDTVAKRDGCDKVRAFDPSGKSGEVKF